MTLGKWLLCFKIKSEFHYCKTNQISCKQNLHLKRHILCTTLMTRCLDYFENKVSLKGYVYWSHKTLFIILVTLCGMAAARDPCRFYMEVPLPATTKHVTNPIVTLRHHYIQPEHLPHNHFLCISTNSLDILYSGLIH